MEPLERERRCGQFCEVCVDVSVSVSLSLSMCLSLSMSVSVSLCRSLSVSLSLCLSVSFSVSLSVSLSLSLFLSLFVSMCLVYFSHSLGCSFLSYQSNCLTVSALHSVPCRGSREGSTKRRADSSHSSDYDPSSRECSVV